MTTCRKTRFSRRALLRGLGAGTALIPMLETDRARAAPAPKRLVIVIQTNGTIKDAFFPRGDGDALSGLTLPDITKPLEPYKGDLIFMGGVAMRNFMDYPGHGGGHENYSMTFTGKKGRPSSYKDPRWEVWEADGPTIDHHILEGLARQGVSQPALRLGVQVERQGSYTAQKRAFWRGPGQPYTPEDSPYKVFMSAFMGRSGGAAAAGFEKLRAERRSILDYLAKDIEGFGKRLGKEDRLKIESHLLAVREVEKTLTPGMAPASAAACGPMAPATLDLNANDSHPRIMQAQFDLAVAALACDASRVVTIQLNNANGHRVVYNWLGIDPKGQEYAQRDNHDIAHRPGAGSRDKLRVEQWYMEQFAGLIKRMKAIPEGSGTLLDNTAVLWTNHMGNGGAHNSNDLPWVIAGRCGGYFKTGRYVRSAGPTNGVLVSLANAMGVATATFGDAKYGGELAPLRG
jgi:hypothetical protein